MDASPQGNAAVGTIAAACIAAMLSMLSLVISKEHKISEFRQAWIDELRNDIAQYIGIISNMFSFIELKKRDSLDELKHYLIEQHDGLAKINELEAKIILRLNPIEHANFIGILKSDQSDETIKRMTNREYRLKYVKDVTDEASNILKFEWSRVKRGEPVFIFAKIVSIVTITIIGIIGWVMYSQYSVFWFIAFVMALISLYYVVKQLNDSNGLNHV